MAKDYVYSDFNAKLKQKIDGDIEILYDEDVIVQSIRNIMATVSGERVRNPIGSGLIQYLFEPMDDDIADDIRISISNVIKKYEPRVEIARVSVRANYEGNFYDVVMELIIRNIKRPVRVATRLRALSETL